MDYPQGVVRHPHDLGWEAGHPSQILFQLTAAQALFAAHDLRLFESMDQGSRTLPEICTRLGIQERAGQALLSMCAGLGYVVRDQDGSYLLADSARKYLLPDSPVYFGGALDQAIAASEVLSFAGVKKALLSNQAQVYGGEKLFESHETQKQRARTFTRAMHSKSLAAAAAWPQVVDLGAHTHLLDVGGGSGAHAIGACRQAPHLRATVFDRPLICELAGELIGEAGLADRIRTVAGNMWTDPLPRADVHFFSDIFHDWPHDKCAFLARKSFEALPPGGKILIHEMLLNDDKTGPFAAAAYNIQMLLWTEGQQWSGQELRQILTEAGFADFRTAATGFGDWQLASAVKPGN
ncbi:MAG: methyltransferase [Thermodesulfobacteriota bacterium]